MMYGSYNISAKLILSLLLSGLIGIVAGSFAISIYASLLQAEGFPKSEFGSGYLSIGLFAVFCGASYSFTIGMWDNWKSRSILALTGGIAFGAIHGLFWVTHGFSHFLGFWSFFMPYSILWGAICALIYGFISHPVFRLFRLSGKTSGETPATDRTLLITSAVAILAALIPVGFEFLAAGPNPDKQRYVVLQSFNECPSQFAIKDLHSIPQMESKQFLLLTINGSYAAGLGPFGAQTAARLRDTHIKTGKIPEQSFLLDASDILNINVTC